MVFKEQRESMSCPVKLEVAQSKKESLSRSDEPANKILFCEVEEIFHQHLLVVGALTT